MYIGGLPLPEKEVARDLSISKYSVSNPTIEVKKCNHTQLWWDLSFHKTS